MGAWIEGLACFGAFLTTWRNERRKIGSLAQALLPTARRGLAGPVTQSQAMSLSLAHESFDTRVSRVSAPGIVLVRSIWSNGCRLIMPRRASLPRRKIANHVMCCVRRRMYSSSSTLSESTMIASLTKNISLIRDARNGFGVTRRRCWSWPSEVETWGITFPRAD